MSSKNTYFNFGTRNDVALVFSAPGLDEEKDQMPVSGVTGENLERLLHLISLAPENDRYDFRITCAGTGIIFKELEGITETQLSELKRNENIFRLKGELRDITKYIIFFGEKAQSVAYLLSDLKAKFVFSKNINSRTLRQIDTDVNNEPIKERSKNSTEERLKVVAKFIIKQMV